MQLKYAAWMVLLWVSAVTAVPDLLPGDPRLDGHEHGAAHGHHGQGHDISAQHPPSNIPDILLAIASAGGSGILGGGPTQVGATTGGRPQTRPPATTPSHRPTAQNLPEGTFTQRPTTPGTTTRRVFTQRPFTQPSTARRPFTPSSGTLPAATRRPFTQRPFTRRPFTQRPFTRPSATRRPFTQRPASSPLSQSRPGGPFSNNPFLSGQISTSSSNFQTQRPATFQRPRPTELALVNTHPLGGPAGAKGDIVTSCPGPVTALPCVEENQCDPYSGYVISDGYKLPYPITKETPTVAVLPCRLGAGRVGLCCRRLPRPGTPRPRPPGHRPSNIFLHN